jgi:hypothetical protein
MRPETRNRLIEKMPQTFLDIVCHGTTLVIDDRIIKKDYDSFNSRLNNFLMEDEKNHSLLILENIARLEKKYRLDNANILSEIQKEILNVKDDIADMDIQSFQQKVRLKNYLMSKILPSFGLSDDKLTSQVTTVLNNRQQISNDVMVENKINPTEEMSYSSSVLENDLFAKYLQTKQVTQTESEKKSGKKRAKEAPSQITIVSKSVNAQSLFTKSLLSGHDVYLHYEKTYSLRNTPFFEDLSINYFNRVLFPFPGVELASGEKVLNIAVLRKAYKGVLLDQLEKEAFDNNPYKQKLTTLNQKLDIILNGEFLQNEGIGIDFVNSCNSNKCYLTKKINEFVLKDENNALHYFAPTRIGVEITLYSDNSISHGAVVVMDNYMPFPFLNSTSPKAPICTGDGKYIFEDNSLSDEMQIIKKINIGEHTMYRGYSGKFTPHSYLTNSRYSSNNATHKIITKKEMEQLGLTPSNI